MEEKGSGNGSRDGVNEYIRSAYDSLKDGDGNSAQGFLRKALTVDFEHEEVIYALKCLNWWLEKIKRLTDFPDSYGKGEYFLSQLKSYHVFLERIGSSSSAFDSCQYALKRFIYSRALTYFLELLEDSANQQDPELLLKTGRCCKGAGDWDEALKYLELAGRFKKDDSGIHSELADVNALLGHDRSAKVLFREAFFLDPQGIDLWSLESEMIVQLRDRVKDMGISEPLLAEWIPVWGCIWGIFSIKRELKPVELGRLKQSILSLENELRSQSSGQKAEQNPLLKPRLLNRYFWLVDHCEQHRDASEIMDETLLKIKFIDPGVYEKYRS